MNSDLNSPQWTSSIATIYPMMIKVYKFNQPRQRLVDERPIKIKKIGNKTSNEDSLGRSIRRTKRMISDYFLCNEFNLWITLTFADQNADNNQRKQLLSDWLKSLQVRYGKFTYLVVPEIHKSGLLHFHGFFMNYPGKLNQAFNPRTGKPIMPYGMPAYNLDDYKLGWSKVQEIGSTLEDRLRLSKYIVKYIQKELRTELGKKRYWSSKGLKLPIKQINPEWYTNHDPKDDDLKFIPTFTNEHGSIYEFTDLNDPRIPEYIRQLAKGHVS